MNCTLCRRTKQVCILHRIESIVYAWQRGIGHLMLRADLVRDGVLREERPS